MNPKIGVVDVGGGFRGIYAAGVLDYCMHKGIWFDLGIGVSAGSANLASYCAKQPMRNHKFYTEYGLRKEYAGLGNYIRSRTLYFGVKNLLRGIRTENLQSVLVSFTK